MNINKKYIIIFGTLILLLVIITGVVTYYKEKEKAEQVQIPDVKKYRLSFSNDYPTNSSEFLGFISLCKNGLFSDVKELKDKKIKQIACILINDTKEESLNSYFPLFVTLDSIISFKPDNYIGVSIDLKDVVREYNESLLEQEKLYFCSISEPSWTDPFYLQIEPKMDLIFDEGDVACGGIKMNKTPSINFSGFVPQAESINIKQYLVDEQTVSDVMNKQSFSEIKEILEDYPIIWQMEKPITP